jgi:uncharacterized membrane protein
MNTDKVKPEYGLTHKHIEEAIKIMNDKQKLDRRELKFEKFIWLCDSFIIALIVSGFFSCILSLAQNEQYGNHENLQALFMAAGITGTVYRLRRFDD